MVTLFNTIFVVMKQYLTYYSQGKFSSEKLSDDIRHLSSALTFILLCLIFCFSITTVSNYSNSMIIL